jgi:CheY-like chemotaxis protein
VERAAEQPDVLVVDGLALFREIEAHYLSRVARVRTAGTAADALAAVAARRPQLIVTSLELPDRPGEELMRELRRRPGTAATPIVALTRGSCNEHARAVRAGASDVLTRTLAHESLVQAVERLVAGAPQRTGLPRARVTRPVRLWDPAHASRGTLRNLSRGGCFVESREWLPAEGEELNLDFGLPGFAQPLALSARLVWRRAAPARGRSGAGLRFLEIDGATSRALGDYVDAAVAFGRAAVA